MKRAAIALLLAAVCACTPSTAEIARLPDTDQDGPTKLASIVAAPRVPAERRVEAAVALVILERRGRRVGLELLASSLAAAPDAMHDDVVAGLATALGRDLDAHDDAFAQKDAATLLLARGLATGSSRTVLATALGKWIERAPFDTLDDERQRYGLRETIRAASPTAARALAAKLRGSAGPALKIAGVVADVGDEKARSETSRALASLAKATRLPAWRDIKRPDVEAANRAAKVVANPAQVDGQLRKYQSNELHSLFLALAKTGDEQATDALLEAAADPQLDADERADALRALSRRAATLDDEALARVFGDGNKADPGRDGDAAFALLARVPRAKDLVDRAMASDRADVRRAMSLALLCSAAAGATPTHGPTAPPLSWPRDEADDECGEPLGAGAIERVLAAMSARKATLLEALDYGEMIGRLPGGAEIARRHLDDASIPARLAALRALQADAPTLRAHESDATPLPPCAQSDEICLAACPLGSVKTVGEWVKRCVESSGR